MEFIVLILLIGLTIWLITKRNKIEHKELVKQISGELRVKYPNFVKAIREVYNEKAKLLTDNNKVLCYKVPVITFNRHMGDLYYYLIDDLSISTRTYVEIAYIGLDKTKINAEEYYLESNEDIEIEEYLEILNEQATEILMDKRYLNSITF